MTFLADALPKLTEREWMAEVIKLAALYGWKTYHTHDSRRSAAGFPDLVLVKRPRCVFAELKAERGRLTDEQMLWLMALHECGQEVYVWRPSDAEKVARLLRGRPGRDRA